jgi:phosphoribosylformimino-5-aminoimidazole carboxamide ribotide isomerase
MLLIPAIDLKDGHCVRLRQGRMDDETVFSDDPVEMARRWVDAGARRLHLVDLNGAFAGAPVNGDAIRAIAAAFPDLPIQVGGGIRDERTIAAYLDAGVTWCIIGTQAVKDPAFVGRACRAFAGNIIVGLDAKDGQVAINGWALVTDHRVEDLARRFEHDGVDAIVYTDIGRDGMMTGLNIAATGLDHRCGQPRVRMRSRAILAQVIRGWKPRLRGIPRPVAGTVIKAGPLGAGQQQLQLMPGAAGRALYGVQKGVAAHMKGA